MSVFSARFSAVAVSAAPDVFGLVAPRPSSVALRSLALAPYSDTAAPPPSCWARRS